MDLTRFTKPELIKMIEKQKDGMYQDRKIYMNNIKKLENKILELENRVKELSMKKEV